MQNSVKAALFALSSVMLFSCQKEAESTKEVENRQLEASSVNKFVSALPSVEQMIPFSERLVTSSARKSRTAMLAVTGDDEQYEQAKQFDEQLLFSDDQEIFYPGALVKARTVLDGSYLPITAPRKPLTLSVSLQGKSGVTPSVTVDNPTLSRVRNALNDLLSKDFEVPPANISYTSEEVHDEQHLKIALGANYNGTVTKVGASAGFSYDNEKKRFLVKIQQVFYTVDLDLPQQPSDLFSDNFDYANAFGDVKPVYVSSIKMGRVLLLGIETTLTKKEAEAKISASFLDGKFDAKAESAYNDLQKSSKITGRVLGGSPKLGGKAITSIEHIKEFLEEGATWSKENPGVAISYKLRELGTNAPFKTVIYSKYFKRDTGRISFDLIVKDNLQTISGQSLATGKGFIRRTNKQGVVSQNEIKFTNGTVSSRIAAYEKREQVAIVFQPQTMGDQEIVFELPSSDSLLRGIDGLQKGNHLYDIDKNNGLLLKDKTDKYTLKIGIHNPKSE
ncbi:thiol-activated cytolysin family protein [Capnocytophaga sp.]|uniref:thiol-activated cytolysin family protein n=1 Tax=Capnocytophaga sp. TaxID=44737 RepID=UPI0026DC7B5B|nr:thiol-activated cytolysin family protein [Capnocytophaga sp.]MDO5105864.1 thiol-activated cytolysin family protein [Capnocytophaga sp.]